jgi:hypothetical protein
MNIKILPELSLMGTNTRTILNYTKQDATRKASSLDLRGSFVIVILTSHKLDICGPTIAHTWHSRPSKL